MQCFVSFVIKIKNGLALLLNKIKKNKVIKKIPNIHSSLEDELNYIFRVLTIYA